MSLKSSKISSSWVSITFAWKQMVSLEVNALDMPPIRSKALAMSRALLFLVPLKIMCSMKWEIPLNSSGSSRDPWSTHTPMDMDLTPGTFSVRTLTPLGSSVFLKPVPFMDVIPPTAMPFCST